MKIINETFWFLLLLLLFIVSGASYAQEPKTEMIPVKKIYDEELNGMELEETIQKFGEPSVKIKVNSTSSKRNMPPFLVDYFNSHQDLVEVLICRWHENNRSIELCYENKNSRWYVFGRTTTIFVKKP